MPETKLTLSNPERLKELLRETECELSQIQPKIEELEAAVQELRELKLTKQRLLTLKMSLSTMIDNVAEDHVQEKFADTYTGKTDFDETKVFNYSELSTLKSFHPDEAFKQVDKVLKQKNSLNYEMFKAVVFSGGKASTEEIKAFLVESGARQPQTGEGFENVPLTEISSRANYLVRKGILQPMGRGNFYSALGWVDPES
jgi:hypothetical protein